MHLCVYAHAYITHFWEWHVCVIYLPMTSDSGVLAALIIALLFFWQTQHRSDKGFITVMCGVSCLHSEQNVVYAAALSPVSSQASL